MRRSSIDQWFHNAKKGKDSGLIDLIKKRKTWDIDVRDEKFRSALFLVAKVGRTAAVEQLLIHGADPNRQSKFGTAAHAAAEEGNEDCLRLLVSYGARLEMRNHKGETVLECAQRTIGDKRLENVLRSADDDVQFDKLERRKGPKSTLMRDSDSWDEEKDGVIATPIPEVKFDQLQHNYDRILAQGPHAFYVRGRLGLCDVTLKKYRRETKEDLLRREFANEVRVMGSTVHFSPSDLRHPSILLLMAACYGPLADQLCMVFEAVERGFLHKLLHVEQEPLDEDTILELARDVACGLLYTHQRGFIHCYLGSHSVVVTESYHAKICNFGYAQAIAEGESSALPISHCEALYEWMAPEQLRGKAADQLCDVYSFGMMIWECVTRKRPFDNIANFKQVMGNGDPRTSKVSGKWSQNIRVLIKDCIKPAENRPSSEQIFEWLDGLTNDRLITTRPATMVMDEHPSLFPKVKVKLGGKRSLSKGTRTTNILTSK